jgi:hypothetical protein
MGSGNVNSNRFHLTNLIRAEQMFPAVSDPSQL